MYYLPYMYQYPNYVHGATQAHGNLASWWTVSNDWAFDCNRHYNGPSTYDLKDYGANPLVININAATKQNNTYRTALWTGNHLQVTLMSINVGDDVGLEMHPNVDQFIRVEQGQGVVEMGKSKDNLSFQQIVFDDSAIMVPAGTWHNVTNTGDVPLKLYTIYAPPNHPFGTVQPTKFDAIAMEKADE